MISRKSGSTLVAVMITVTVFSALLGVIANVTRTQANNTHRILLRAQATAYGDAVLESLYDQWRDAMITATDSTDRLLGRTQAYLTANMSAPTTAQLPEQPGITLSSWSVRSVTPMLQPTTNAEGRPDPEQGTNSRLRMRLIYLAKVDVAYVGAGTQGTVTLERPFIRAGRNLFDNFFFGTLQETEFHPGAEMYVDGTVYAGGNLYTAHDYLHLLKDTTFLGNHIKDYFAADPRKGDDPTIDNAPSFFNNNWDQTRPPRPGTEQKLFDTPTNELEGVFLDHDGTNNTDSDASDNPDTHLNNDGYREMIEKPYEPTTDPDPLRDDPLQLDLKTSERLYKNADYHIEVASDNSVEVYQGNYNTGNGKWEPLQLDKTSDQYKAIKDSLVLNTALKDWREGGNIRVVSVDISKIKSATDTGKIGDVLGDGDGLLLYVQDKTNYGVAADRTAVATAQPKIGGAGSAVTIQKSGVKLTNGGRLPSIGLTVATPHTLYIQGDYNSGKNGTTQPPSNTATSYTPPNDKPSSVTAGYNRAPSAVAADAVNILSNAWNDVNSTAGIGSRVASNTTVNTAIIAGNVPTSTATDYSGGIENFVRFHENWSNKYYTIYGTLAALYNSAEAKGTWKTASYNPPNRRWYYDTNFQDANPPGFRVARVYERGAWTSR
jgi:hypothetical protein